MTETSLMDSAQHDVHSPGTVKVEYKPVPMRNSKKQQKLLVIESKPGVLSRYTRSFDDFEMLLAHNSDSALAQVDKYHPEVVILDPHLNPNDTDAATGLELLESIMKQAPTTKVIVITAADHREDEARAVGIGAYDCYQQPVDNSALNFIIEHAFEAHALEEMNRSVQLSGKNDEYPHGIITCCPEMKQIFRTVEKVAPTLISVLLLGKSGTGKELLAKALHSKSPRENAPFVAINCAAIPESLLESELFGHEKGAFTGATNRVIGKIERADGGTLFLDEIGDIPVSLQAKLLRFLQERVIQRVGGHEDISINTRVVCATHQNLEELMDKHQFRDDLYYRISEITINIPALRDRPGDSLLLAREFLRQASDKHKKLYHGFSSQALDIIDSYSWPGNIRELKNCINRAVNMAEGHRIEAADLALPTEQHTTTVMDLRQLRDNAERDALTKAISIVDGNISLAAQLLGTSRTTVYDLMSKHGMK